MKGPLEDWTRKSVEALSTVQPGWDRESIQPSSKGYKTLQLTKEKKQCCKRRHLQGLSTELSEHDLMGKTTLLLRMEQDNMLTKILSIKAQSSVFKLGP